MSGPPMILFLIANSQNHAANPTNPATQTRASIANTKGPHSSSKRPVATGKQSVALLSSSNSENLLQNDRSPEENNQLLPRCQTKEEEIEPFYEILPAPENSSALVPHQSPTEEVI
ncbi:hypothetical protein Pyn_17190 [Prunus yedoensis var. nudiflora]|uniref:Uncharacterized protein n=1 Tax=Prunus yedoensis var. nudiflora TaxID=2094558 RepID=A0A314UTW8_PRUYE|nr:hypothetical protein Pyn_17190 [Prunus yedoensis var. nudiflora]